MPRSQGAAASAKQTAVNWIDAQQSRIVEMSETIWQYAEPPFEEFRTYTLLTEELRKAGFALEEHVAGLPTAFVASFTHGSGKPVIGIVAEFDTPTMAGLSQKAATPYRAELVPGDYGHGCGHNLIAASSVAAVIALKEALMRANIAGTIKLFGTPAEEEVTGKVYMVDAGVFNGLDAALAWHPGGNFEARYGMNNAMNRSKFVFRGKTREEALRAAFLFQDAADLEEPVTTIRGTSVEVRVSVSRSTRQEADQRLDAVREAAALAAAETGTELQENFVIGVYQRLPNERLVNLMDQTLRQFVPLQYTAEELEFAKKIAETFFPLSEMSSPEEVLPQVRSPSKDVGGGNDNADVSWLTPFISIRGGAFINGPEGWRFPVHTWQATSMSSSSIAHKSMPVMAKTLAAAAIDLMTQPGLLAEVRKEFEEKTKGFVYRANVPKDKNWRWLRR
ncbi:MAG: M20/M25/M40 family metallo-hydrolase [Acidobacteria bacterium]|nr:M20/M25/M40 family metallo-hydrolase [Acidobacteriota bacterium]